MAGHSHPVSRHISGRFQCIFLGKSPHPLIQRGLTGFAAGVMVAASVWSLLIPAMEQAARMGPWAVFPAAGGFWLGILFLLLLDRIIPHLHMNSRQAEGPKTVLGKTAMLVLAVTLHNLPEGMAVGVVYAGLQAGSPELSSASALALSLGIAIQNFPEEPSSPCPCGHPAQENFVRLSTAYYPGS